MRPEDAFEKLGNQPTVTFGCQYGDGVAGVESEIVGPLVPNSVYYGGIYRGREYGPSPLVFFNFNKYRPDLPPWHSVHEFVLADEDDGSITEFTFEGAVEPQGTQITGDLKTVSLAAAFVLDGVQTETFDRDDVADKRGMDTSNVRDGSEFKVDGVLK